MPEVIVFCGYQAGCAKRADGTLVVLTWQQGDEQALERRMTLCDEHRHEAEALALEMHDVFSQQGFKVESRWVDEPA